MLKELVT